MSQLKKLVGNHLVEASLPQELEVATELVYEPEALLSSHTIKQSDIEVAQVLIQWRGIPLEEATWMDHSNFVQQFSSFCLGDKANFPGRALITDIGYGK